MEPVPSPFLLPVWFDLAATTCFALTGALAGARRGFDIVGVCALAFLTGLGGGIIRDAFFIQQGPPVALTDARYLIAVLAGAVPVLLGAGKIAGLPFPRRTIAAFDALGLGAYAVFGTQKALLAGLPPLAAVLVGTVNAVGGGLLRDIVSNEIPLVFRPGQFYLLVAVLAAVLFVFLTTIVGLTAQAAAFGAIAVTFPVRMATILLNWHTTPVVADGRDPRLPNPPVA